MKIEMGESLLYSWLRHVKDCQIVQTNWKMSPQWDLCHLDELQTLREDAGRHFQEFFDSDQYDIFKKSPLSQMLSQAEVDVLGVQYDSGLFHVYAIDVAFHENGLQYGAKEETVARVIKKCLRTAMCLYGCFGLKSGEIIFASPKVHHATLMLLKPAMESLQEFMCQHGYDFAFRLIVNEEFNSSILEPILLVSANVSDTSELFMRGYQMYQMFTDNKPPCAAVHHATTQNGPHNRQIEPIADDTLRELKVGKIAQTVLRSMLENGSISPEELQALQTKTYSKEKFDLQYSLLVREDTDFEWERYYSKPLIINRTVYYMCSQWFEVPANNDRPYLLSWIKQHEQKDGE